MANPRGTTENLTPARRGNRNALKAGVYSRRAQEPRARELADAVMAAPHTVPLDQFAADEIGAIKALIDAIDGDLGSQGLRNRKGDARDMIGYRIRASARLESLLRQFGLTPHSRADWAATVAHGGLLAEMARRREEQ